MCTYVPCLGAVNDVKEIVVKLIVIGAYDVVMVSGLSDDHGQVAFPRPHQRNISAGTPHLEVRRPPKPHGLEGGACKCYFVYFSFAS